MFRGMPRRVKGALRNLEFHFKASSWCSKLFFVFTITRPRRISDNAFHFLLPAPGNGNVGDQAMAESFINYVGHNCVLIVEDQNYFRQKIFLLGKHRENCFEMLDINLNLK